MNGASISMDSSTFRGLFSAQLSSSGVPTHLWEALRRKVLQVPTSLDAGESFSLSRAEDEEGSLVGWKAIVVKEGGIRKDDQDSIWLVDHAWTFRPSDAESDLRRYQGLMDRLKALFDMDESSTEEDVSREKWKFANVYSVRAGMSGGTGDVEDTMPFWYINDEFGSRIQDSETAEAANVRMVPFVLTVQEGFPVAYSLLFPIKDVDEGDEILRDYLEGPEATDDSNRAALSNVWRRTDLTHVDWRQAEEPKEEFFAAGRQNETVPPPDFSPSPLPTDRPIRVFSAYGPINKHLKHERFEVVEDESEADVMWHTRHVKDYAALAERHPAKRVNQFPYECVLTVKDLLCAVCRRKRTDKDDDGSLSTTPKWLPTTYNLKTELPKFVSYFQSRENKGLDNHWIVKPWNLARGMDMHVTPYLERILRQPFSGPKIAQKYIHDPVLFERPGIGKVKFDIRYILLLSSAKPKLEAYAYSRFWLRFANQPFALSDYDSYDRHFTVMNYRDDSELKQMFCHDFVREFESQYPDHPWSGVESSIMEMFREMFEAAGEEGPPRGIPYSPQSRAMFAADLMLSWEEDGDGKRRRMQPKLLEVNFGPDCDRACMYYPEFFDNVFSVLYLGETQGQNVIEL